MKKVTIIFFAILFSFLSSCKKDGQGIESKGITFSTISNYNPPYGSIESNIVEYNEIIGYDPTEYIFLLSDEAGKRIREVNYPVSPTPFAVVVDEEIIYIANFIPGYSSMSCDQCITMEPYSYNNQYRVALGYPSSDFYTGIDPRNDSRLIARFRKDKKLMTIKK